MKASLINTNRDTGATPNSKQIVWYKILLAEKTDNYNRLGLAPQRNNKYRKKATKSNYGLDAGQATSGATKRPTLPLRKWNSQSCKENLRQKISNWWRLAHQIFHFWRGRRPPNSALEKYGWMKCAWRNSTGPWSVASVEEGMRPKIWMTLSPLNHRFGDQQLRSHQFLAIWRTSNTSKPVESMGLSRI